MVQGSILRRFRSNSVVSRYGIAVGSVIAVMVFRSLLHPVLGDRSRYIIFLLAVLVTAWYSGSLPALITLALGIFVGNTFFVEPYLTFKFESLSDALAVSIYALIGMANIYLIYVVKRREDQLAAQIIKQAEVENALRTSQDRFRLATEALQGAIYDWDATTDVAYRASALSEIVGYPSDEILNTRKWWQDLMHPDDFEEVQQSLKKRIDEHAPIHSVEYRVRHKDGHYIWVWDKSRILYNAEGQLIRLIGCTLSIDERMILAESLIQSEERFRVAFENASDAMAMSDEAGFVVAANEAYFQLYGYSAEEVIGHGYEIIFPEDVREQSRQLYRQAFDEQGELPIYESTVKRKDGTIRTVEARIGFVAPRGQRLYMLSVVRDLTERKQSEEALYTRYQLTTDLTHAVSAEEVGQITVDRLMERLGANTGNIYIYHAVDDTFDLLYANSRTMSPGMLAQWRHFPADPIYPITDVVRHSKSLWFSSPAEWETAYPSTKQFSRSDLRASVLLPLVVAAGVLGVITFTFSEVHSFTVDEQVFITSLVFQCAQAMERARLAEMAQELAVIEERHRLARDLHDNVSQLLFSSSVISEMLPRLLTNKPEKALQQADQLHLMVRGAMAEMRTLLWELRPENIIQTKLSSLLTQLSYAAQARQEIRITLKAPGDNEFILPPDVQVTFYRIAQESLHNSLKYGQAAAISIALRQTDKYTALVVVDNGQGFDTKIPSAGFGLRNMQERAASVGARFSIKSQIGKGTRIRLMWTAQIPVMDSV